MKKIVLDTNAYTALMAGDEQVLAVLSRSDIVYMSVIVLGELYAGFKGGSREAENTALLKSFLKKSTVDVLEATEETSILFGRVKNNLRRAGTPLPINDVWIATHAFETGAVLVTFDTHFNHIPDLRIWREP